MQGASVALPGDGNTLIAGGPNNRVRPSARRMAKPALDCGFLSPVVEGGAEGTPGWVRSSACIWLFSSTLSTMTCVGSCIGEVIGPQ